MRFRGILMRGLSRKKCLPVVVSGDRLFRLCLDLFVRLFCFTVCNFARTLFLFILSLYHSPSRQFHLLVVNTTVML